MGVSFLVPNNNWQVYDTVIWLHPDLSGEPTFDLASLQPPIRFVLGCRERRHSIRGGETLRPLRWISPELLSAYCGNGNLKSPSCSTQGAALF